VGAACSKGSKGVRAHAHTRATAAASNVAVPSCYVACRVPVPQWRVQKKGTVTGHERNGGAKRRERVSSEPMKR